jgi:hypothetical protein
MIPYLVDRGARIIRVPQPQVIGSIDVIFAGSPWWMRRILQPQFGQAKSSPSCIAAAPADSQSFGAKPTEGARDHREMARSERSAARARSGSQPSATAHKPPPAQ